MSKATYPLKLPVSIKRAAERLAKEDRVRRRPEGRRRGDGEGVFRRARKGRIGETPEGHAAEGAGPRPGRA